MAEERQILLEIEVDNDKAQQELNSTAAQIEINKNELSELNKEYKEGSISVQEYAKRKAVLINENKKLGKEQRAIQKSLDAEKGSLNALRDSLSRLTAERNATNQSTEQGRKRFSQLQKQILETTNAIKGQEEAGGDFRRSVGDYGKALTSNIPLLNRYVGELTAFRSGLIGVGQGLTSTTKGLTGASKALRIFRIALISTGVGALVVALGSLITFLTTTQRGMDAVTKVTRPLQQIFQRLIGVVQDLGGDAFDALAKAIDNPIEALKNLGQLIVDNIINRFKALQVFGEAVSALFAGEFTKAAKLAADASIQLGTGITNATDRIINAGESLREFVNEAVDAGTRIDQLNKQIERGEIRLIKVRSENLRILKEQNEIAENQSKTLEDRIDSAQKSVEAVNRISEESINLQLKRIELLKLEAEANDTDLVALKEIAEAEAELDRIRTEASERRTTQVNKLNTLLKQQQGEIGELSRLETIRFDLTQATSRKIIAIDNETTKNKLENLKLEEEAERLKNENTLLSTAELSGSLTSLFKENTIAYKTFASIDAAISTYTAINKTLASLPFPANVISSVGIGIQGFANVARINGLIGGGGASSSSATTSQPRITRTDLSGAFDRNQLTSNANNQQNQTNQIRDTLRNQPVPVVRVTDINKKQRDRTQTRVTGSL